ncbi:hypothetical protein OSB04_un001572 [Centaurea solstitialis]|uniref:VLRF1 domain-containing protein n=1 Tax=Centaurea solstitialis TaxID=347529 RepID=A0AA38S321_9ASTR|nr:hypothetical protein OSB04_un001572 [Centaurea solstitialis]
MEMESTSGRRIAAVDSSNSKIRSYSIFEVPSNSFRFVERISTTSDERETAEKDYRCNDERLTCNTCNSTFQSLHHQRSHFKSDFHRFNVKLSTAGKDTVKEDDFDEWTSTSSVKDYDISSISGSEDEDEDETEFGHLILLEHDLSGSVKDDDTPCVTMREVTEKLLNVINEPRDNTHFRVMLLASGGHFVGCVFDGNSVVAHKTFHRYVTRAKAGRKQSSEDGSGKIAHSAGASIRRHNELALKKDIQELLAAWKPYIDASACIIIYAPSHNQKLLFDGQTPCFSCPRNNIRHIPLTVRRPTFKEAQRLYKILTQVSIEPDEEIVPIIRENSTSTLGKENLRNNLDKRDVYEGSFVENPEVLCMSLPLHEAAKAGNADKVLELLEQGLDPCVVDERGRTPYRLAEGKEVRNAFRRFMALNVDKWDWRAAKVPSPLTKEMEVAQNVKQVIIATLFFLTVCSLSCTSWGFHRNSRWLRLSLHIFHPQTHYFQVGSIGSGWFGLYLISVA